MGGASGQPSGGRTPAHGQPEIVRNPKRHGSRKRRTVEVYGCVSREVAAEIERLRSQGGKKLSRSAVIAGLLEKGVQAQIDMQYGALLKPILEGTIKQELRSISNRLAALTADAFYSAEQTRILVITLLSYLLGDQTDILPGLIAQAQKEAHQNLKSLVFGKEEEKL